MKPKRLKMIPSKLRLILSISVMIAALTILILSGSAVFETNQALAYVLVLSCVFLSKLLEKDNYNPL